MRNIHGEIQDGTHDDILNDIVQAIRDRKNAIGASVANQLKPGDKVVFNDNTRPLYMVGVTATVKRKLPKNVVILIEEDQGRFRAGAEIKTSPQLLDLVSS